MRAIRGPDFKPESCVFGSFAFVSDSDTLDKGIGEIAGCELINEFFPYLLNKPQIRKSVVKHHYDVGIFVFRAVCNGGDSVFEQTQSADATKRIIHRTREIAGLLAIELNNRMFVLLTIIKHI